VERHLDFARLHNFRDLGGYRGFDGRTVRWRRLYRADSLGKLVGDDLERYRGLGIRTVIDLRHPWEITDHGRVPDHDGATYHNISIEHQAWDLAGLPADIEPAQFLSERYLEVADDGVQEIRQVLDILAAPALDEADAVVFHCAAGKDRTGLITAVILELLGVSEDDIVADFALTELARDRFLADWQADHPGELPRWVGFGRSPAPAMRMFLAELTRRYGSIRGYATTQLAITPDLIASLRQRYLTPPP
jgi:protein-tyrosine phosphatase